MVLRSVDLLNPIKKYTIGDGYTELLVDLEKSNGVWLYNKFSGEKYLDFFSFYASAPLGFNHPSMLEDDEFLRRIKFAGLNKVSNSDFYTEEMAEFVSTFTQIVVPEEFSHLFFISGGALAVENALKASFDWKIKKNFQNGINKEIGTKVLHFKEAFHGRTGYTLSLTNTADPRKYQYFPKFNWPRVINPKIKFPLKDHLEEVIQKERQSIDQIEKAFEENKNDIAAIIIEPIQGEGGDNHFRGEFLKRLRNIANDYDAMFIYDEIQTGIGLTGKMWAMDHFEDAKPDIISFGKKTQVCGIMVNSRVDEIEKNVFTESSRINSTWGGNIVDMVRSSKYLKIIENENLINHVNKMGIYLSKIMTELQETFEVVRNFRHRGLFAAFDLPNKEYRDNLKKILFKKNLIMLGSGINSIRFRPPLIVKEDHIDTMGAILRESLKEIQNT